MIRRLNLDKNDTWLCTIIPEYIPTKDVLLQRTVLEEYSYIPINMEKRTQGMTHGIFICPTAIYSSDINRHGQPTEEPEEDIEKQRETQEQNIQIRQ